MTRYLITYNDVKFQKQCELIIKLISEMSASKWFHKIHRGHLCMHFNFVIATNFVKFSWKEYLYFLRNCANWQTFDVAETLVFLRGTATPTPNLADFVLYLKIINTSWKIKNASYSKLLKELKNGIMILVQVGQVLFKLWIKTFKLLSGSITQELLGLPKFWCYFWVPWTIIYKLHVLFFIKVLMILR